jgi:Ca2+-binding RTX toxin-like protein
MPTIVTVDNNTTAYNGVFSDNGEIYNIKPLGYVLSTDYTPTVVSYGHQNIYLGNQGWIINNHLGGVGVAFVNSTGAIDNSGHIVADIGVDLEATGVTLTNSGAIEGFGVANENAAIYLGPLSQNINIHNQGYIHGSRAGIQDSSHLGGNDIYNYEFKTIAGDVFGVDIKTLAGKITFVENEGTIKGGTAAIQTEVGTLHLANDGTIDGQVHLTSNAEDDFIQNWGEINGAVKLGGGADKFYGFNGKTGTVYGQAGNDILWGSDKAADTLIGGDGADKLNGQGGGNDVLMGGQGADKFYFDTAFASAGVTKILDFAHGVDKISLESDVFVGLGLAGTLAMGKFYEGAAAHDADDRIVYNPANGYLIYDSNGNAAGGQHHFATLAAQLTLTNADFLVT